MITTVTNRYCGCSHQRYYEALLKTSKQRTASLRTAGTIAPGRPHAPTVGTHTAAPASLRRTRLRPSKSSTRQQRRRHRQAFARRQRCCRRRRSRRCCCQRGDGGDGHRCCCDGDHGAASGGGCAALPSRHKVPSCPTPRRAEPRCFVPGSRGLLRPRQHQQQ